MQRKRALTEKQRIVLAFVGERLAATGTAPSVREVGAAIGVASTCTVQRHLEALERKGYLERGERFDIRGWRPTPWSGVPRGLVCPHCGEEVPV